MKRFFKTLQGQVELGIVNWRDKGIGSDCVTPLGATIPVSTNVSTKVYCFLPQGYETNENKLKEGSSGKISRIKSG